jgi:hypothetical protein
MHDICPNSMSMTRTKESPAVDAVDGLRERDASLLNKNSRMCPVPLQGVLKVLNTSFAVAILRDPPEMTTKRKEGRSRWKLGSHLFRQMTRAGFATLHGIRNIVAFPTPILSSNASVPSSSPPRLVPALTQEAAPSTHWTSSPLSYNSCSAVTPERVRSQDSTSSQRRRDDRDYPPMLSGSNPHSQEMSSHLFLPRHSGSAQLHRSISMDTTFTQGRSHSPSRMSRTSSTILPGRGSQPTSTQFESGLASGTGQMRVRARRQESRPRFPSTLQSLLSNDFRCVVRCRAVHHNDCCTIIRRFRILVVGKVCIMYHTGRRRN